MTTELDNSAILRKIRNCLELSKSQNQHEAAVALKQMKQLMDKYQIDLAELDASFISETNYQTSHKANIPNYMNNLYVMVADVFDCEVIVQRYHKSNVELIIMGDKTACEICSYSIDVLSKQLIKQRKKYIEENLGRYRVKANKTKMADAYCTAWVQGVREKCKNLSPNEEIRSKINSYMERKFGGMLSEIEPIKRFKNTESNIMNAVSKGFEDSENVNLFAATGYAEKHLIQ